MKKKLFVIALAVGLLAANFTVISTASALSVDKCDEMFAQALSEFMADEGYGSQTIAADKQIVYDMGLEELGVLYTFTAGGEDGYAVVVDSTEGCTLSECFFGAENPYSGVEGTKVYAGPMIYLGYEDGEYTLGGEALSDEEVADIADTAYAASGSFTTSSETVYYTYRSYDGYALASRPPRYIEVGLESACAPIAGGNIIGYYDRYCTNLIPDFTPGVSVGNGLYMYLSQSDEVDAMIFDLYDDMGTTSIGTTYDQFISGMQTYCSRAGYTFSYSDCMSGGSLNYSYVKSEIDAGRPVALFVSQYTVSTVSLKDGYDSITNLHGTGNHVMAGFGYYDITYTLSSGGTRNSRYIEVSTGLGRQTNGYFNIDRDTTINDACSINIY
ncbi:MAG TPA: hypothetical protein H9693_06655 [Firmicutes bacterium]|nr:hypothetical protein [Bacillota bacterium]